MEKPLTLRTETWDFITAALKQHDQQSLNIDAIIENPGPFLYKHNVLDKPELLQETVIELDDSVDYVIDLQAAQSLKRGDPFVALLRLSDNEKFLKPISKVIEAIANPGTFDQLSLR